MGLKETINRTHVRWMDSDAPESDIVISSRIRIARNIKGIKFPHLMSRVDAESVFHGVQLAISQPEIRDSFSEMELVELMELSSLERRILMEKHLISPDLLKEHEKKAVVISDDERISIMLNEEDHLRIQCLLPGLQLLQGWRFADKLDDMLEQTLEYAFTEQLGYLTVCPTNVGTGLRASAMLHLPGLGMLNQMNRVVNAISKLGLTVRGLYGEGTEALGNMYQVSNQITLGLTEEEIIDKLTSVIKQLIEQERAARQALYRDNQYPLEDKIYRAYGILKYCRTLSTDEVMKLISDVRLGMELKIINQVSSQALNELITMTTPAYLQKYANKEISPQERDILRAKIVRQKIDGQK